MADRTAREVMLEACEAGRRRRPTEHHCRICTPGYGLPPDTRPVITTEEDAHESVRTFAHETHIASVWGPAVASDDWFMAAIGTGSARHPSRNAALEAMRQFADTYTYEEPADA